MPFVVVVVVVHIWTMTTTIGTLGVREVVDIESWTTVVDDHQSPPRPTAAPNPK